MTEGSRMNEGSSSFGRLDPRSAEVLGAAPPTEITHAGDTSTAPKVLPTYVAEPEEGVWEISVVLENRPELLPRLEETIEQQGLAMTSVQAFAPSGDSRTSFRCLARPSGSTSKEAALSAVLATPGVIDANIEEDQGRFFVASGFPLVGLNGVRLATFTASHLAGLCRDVQEALGSGGSFLLYKQGLLLGERTWNDYLERIGRPYGLLAGGYGMRLSETMGGGQVELVSVHHLSGVAEVRVRDSFECLGRSADHPVCQLFRGHLAGAFSALWQRPVDCFEEKCTAEGHSACTYLIAMRSPGAERPLFSEVTIPEEPTPHMTESEESAQAPDVPVPEREDAGPSTRH